MKTVRASEAVAAFLLSSVVAGFCQGGRIISFNLYADNARNLMWPGDAAGAPGVRTTNWNQLSSSALSLIPGTIKDDSGAVVPNLSVTLTPRANFSDRAAGVTNDNKMLCSVIDKFDGAPGVLTVSNIPYSVYSVYFYQRPDYPSPGDGLDKTRGGYFTLTNHTGRVERRYISTQDKSTAVALPMMVNSADGEGYVLANTTNIASSGSFAQVDGGNYVKFGWLTNSDFTVLMSALGDGAADDAGNVITNGDSVRRLKWSGFQIEEVPFGVATNLSLLNAVPDLFQGDSTPFAVQAKAEFDNGTSANVSEYPMTQYVSEDTNVFAVSAAGVVQPLAPGTASLVIAFQGLSLTQSVNVLAPVSLCAPTVLQSNLVVSSLGGEKTTAVLLATFPGHTNVDVSDFHGAVFSGGPPEVVNVAPDGAVSAVGEGSFFIVGSYGGISATNQDAGTVTSFESSNLRVDSPDGSLSLFFSITNLDGSASCPVYRVTRNGATIVAPSRLGLTFGGAPLREHLMETSWTTNTHDSVWHPVAGERDSVRDQYNELEVNLQETVPPGRRAQLAFRAYDAGVALCYTVPEQPGLAGVSNLTEQTEFRFTGDPIAWATTSAQGLYTRTPLSSVPDGCERPLTIQLATNLYVALAEARLVDYARMKFNQLGQPGGLVSALSGSVNSSLPLTTPWRVVMAGDSPGELLENNALILNLNAPNQIADTSWIKPGKCIREVTLSTTGGRACVDFAAKHHLQYIEFDAGWYGPEGSSTDATRVDPSRSLDLTNVIQYASEHGVGVILYVNHIAMEAQSDILPSLYRSWGVKGIKIGFVNVGPQPWTEWLHEIIRKCSTNHILVDVHDEYRMTGYSRTYPNFMTAEGISGDETTPAPEQTLTLLFTRMLAGAADHTFCYFDNRVTSQWTHAYQLAKAVCFYSPWQFLYWYDRPTNSIGYVDGAANCITEEPELEFFDALPTVWNQTRVVRGSIGEYAVIARRSGEEWFIGALNAGQTRDFSVPLDFLTTNRLYLATRYSDDPVLATRTRVRLDHELVSATNVLRFSLTAANGEAWHLVPVAPPAFTSIARGAQGAVSLSITGLLHAPFSLWRSADLARPMTEWVRVTAGEITNNPVWLEDAATGGEGGFYRLGIP